MSTVQKIRQKQMYTFDRIVVGVFTVLTALLAFVILIVFVFTKRHNYVSPLRLFHPVILFCCMVWMSLESLYWLVPFKQDRNTQCGVTFLRGTSAMSEYLSVSCILAWLLCASFYRASNNNSNNGHQYGALEAESDTESDVTEDSDDFNFATQKELRDRLLKFHRVIFIVYIVLNFMTALVVCSISIASCAGSDNNGFWRYREILILILDGSNLVVLYLCIAVTAVVGKCTQMEGEKKNMRYILAFTIFGLVNAAVMFSRILVHLLPYAKGSPFTDVDLSENVLRTTTKGCFVLIIRFMSWEGLPMVTQLIVTILQWSSDELVAVPFFTSDTDLQKHYETMVSNRGSLALTRAS